MAVHQSKRRRQLNLGQLTGWGEQLLQAIVHVYFASDTWRHYYTSYSTHESTYQNHYYWWILKSLTISNILQLMDRQTFMWFKKEKLSTKKPSWKRCEIKWALKASSFDKFKSLIIMASLESVVILGAKGCLMLIVSKFLIKMTRPQSIVLFILMFCNLVIFIKTFDPINTVRH